MNEVVKLKSRFVSSRLGQGTAAVTETDDAAARLVEGILRRKSFYFQQRTGKLDMRAIGRVDVNKVVEEVDIDTLQAHLENITFADVTEDDLRLYSDQCFLNLFRLSQLLLEYLLSVQDTLATSLEALASKHSAVRKAVDKGRAELHAVSEQDRALKREIRQKRATIARYEQLLALPAPPSGARSNSSNQVNVHSCLTCGKIFTATEFLQQHIVRKHGHQVGTANSTSNHEAGEADCKGADEEKAVFPPQLRLFVQTSTGRCLDMMVQGGATVAQLRGYINSTAGFAAADASNPLVYRGVHLHNDQTLKECEIPTGGQLVLLDSKGTPASGEGKSQQSGKSALQTDTDAEESAAVKQISTLVDLMRQQMEWSMRSEDGRREQGVGAAEALETRMRQMEASLPRRLQESVEDSVGELKNSLRKAFDGMEELHVKRSNAGALQDDEDETRAREAEEKARLASLMADMKRVSEENETLRQELTKVKVKTALASTAASPIEVPRPNTQNANLVPSQQQVSRSPPEDPVAHPPAGSHHKTPPKASMWDLTFPQRGSRLPVTVTVWRSSTCETVCESIAEELDVEEARVVLRDNRGGAIVPPETLSVELRALHEGSFLELDVLQGDLLSDHVVDGLVDFYEQHIPVKARESDAVTRSMAEIDLAAKRHTMARRKSEGLEGGTLGLGDIDATDRAEKQVESIRAQLSATLSGGRFLANNTDLSRSMSVSRSTPDFGLPAKPAGFVRDISDAAMFGGEEGSKTELSLAELERTVQERKRARPAGIERQMGSVSKSMEEQLSLLLEEAEDELDQLEQDSLGSDVYSSTDPSLNGAVAAFADPPTSSRVSSRVVQGEHAGDASQRGSTSRVIEGKGASDAINTRALGRVRSERVARGGELGSLGGRAGDEDEEIAKSDWGKTLDTMVSIPEGPEQRADEHEANASLAASVDDPTEMLRDR